jgi:VCBS repeat-containing protein
MSGRTRIALAAAVAALSLAVAVAPASAVQSPYTQTGSIAAYDADGAPLAVSYYDRPGGGGTATVQGDLMQSQVAWTNGPDGGPVPVSQFNGFDENCLRYQPWPFSTVPTSDDPADPGYQNNCWDLVFDPFWGPGTYGILMPPSHVVDGETQVFDDWDVTGAITAGHCRTGDMGIGVVGNQGGPDDTSNPFSPEPFARGPEYRIWTDLDNDLGMNATIAAHYASVSPDSSAPLVTIAPAIDCAVVEQHTTTLLADFGCEEPAGLGSGVASCVATDAAGAVQDGDLLDTSTVGTHSFTVTAVDEAGNNRLRTMHYTVEEANDAPTALELANTTVEEKKPAGTAVGTFDTTDEDVGDTFTYSLVNGDGSTDNASFSIDGDTLKTAETFDYFAKNSYAIRVRTTDAGGKSFERSFTIGVVNLIEPTLTPADVAENAPAGTIVGTLFDDASSSPFSLRSYSLVPGPGDTDNGSFSIEHNAPASGIQSTLKTAASFDFETKNTYQIHILMFREAQLYEKALTISVTDVNEPPTAGNDSYTTAEDTPLQVDDALGVLANDSDPDGDPLAAEVVAGPAHGTLTLDADGSFSYAPAANYSGSDSFTYTASDGSLESNTATVALTVTAGNDAPTVTVAAGGSCGANDRSGTVNLDVRDVDNPAGTLTISAQSSNPALVPNANLVFGGAGGGGRRTLSATAANGRTGTAVLTITVSDGQKTGTVPVTFQAAGSGKDTLTGTAGADMLLAQNGNDTVNALGGNDLLCGGAHNDLLSGGDGDDTVAGGAGNDRLTGGTGVDEFHGGAGSDRATDSVTGETLTSVEQLGP